MIQFRLSFGNTTPQRGTSPVPIVQVFTVPLMAKALGVPEQKITALCRAGKIPANKATSGVWYCTPQNWALYLERQSQLAILESNRRAAKTEQRKQQRHERMARAAAQQKLAQRRNATTSN
jgi:plasmid maintenance system antidote protein VapI